MAKAAGCGEWMFFRGEIFNEAWIAITSWRLLEKISFSKRRQLVGTV